MVFYMRAHHCYCTTDFQLGQREKFQPRNSFLTSGVRKSWEISVLKTIQAKQLFLFFLWKRLVRVQKKTLTQLPSLSWTVNHALPCFGSKFCLLWNPSTHSTVELAGPNFFSTFLVETFSCFIIFFQEEKDFSSKCPTLFFGRTKYWKSWQGHSL